MKEANGGGGKDKWRRCKRETGDSDTENEREDGRVFENAEGWKWREGEREREMERKRSRNKRKK